MPHLFLDGRSIFYERSGLRRAPVLLLSGALGTTLEMWEPQVAELQERYEIIRYDMRGHGESSTPAGPYSIDQLGGDVVALIEALSLTDVAFCGLSIGGVIGQWLAIHADQHFRAFIFANTAARIGTPATWSTRISTVQERGFAAIEEVVIERWFTDSFRKSSPQIVGKMRRMLLRCDPKGYVAACASLRDLNLRASICSIRKPTCILAGEQDLVTNVMDAKFMQENIAGSSLVQIPAAHLSNVEAPASFNAAVVQFLPEQGSQL